MVQRVPANYRQSAKVLADLDAISGLLVGGGGVIAISVLTGHAPWSLKIPEATISLGLGAFFGLLRWPPERGQGDRMTQWARRAFTYYMRTKRFSAWAATCLDPSATWIRSASSREKGAPRYGSSHRQTRRRTAGRG